MKDQIFQAKITINLEEDKIKDILKVIKKYGTDTIACLVEKYLQNGETEISEVNVEEIK